MKNELNSRLPKKGVPSRAPTPGLRLLFWCVTVLSPLILLASVEALLRICSVGTDIRLFHESEYHGHKLLTMNPALPARYFSRIPFHPAVACDAFEMPKPPATYRIFCLGGSTTAGFPFGPAGSFPSFLRDRLQLIFPERRIEVINLGIMATNSYTTLDIASELEEYSPDLLVVYDGHNEFYGALGAASHEAGFHSRRMNLLALRLVHLRSFLLARDLFNAFRPAIATSDDATENASMMELLARDHLIPFGSVQYRRALDDFTANIDALVRLCAERQIPIILGTQTSNLRDLPPFVSQFQPGLPPAQRMRFDQCVNQGIEQELNGRYTDALGLFRAAGAIDSLRADPVFHTAVCLDSLGRHAEARMAYEHARDLDQLRFRASEDFNDVIRKMERKDSAVVADVERAFRDASYDSLVGRSLLFEHVHPNARGCFLMAKEFARIMAIHGIMASREEWARRDTLADSLHWNNRTMTRLDERCAALRVERLTSTWPFAASRRKAPTPSLSDSLETIAEDVVDGQLSWPEAHTWAASYYNKRGMPAEAEREYRLILRQFPYDSLLTVPSVRAEP